MAANKSKSLQKAIDEGTIQPLQWYWVVWSPSININRMAFNEHLPLLERGKFSLVDIKEYFISQYVKGEWHGVMLKRISVFGEESRMVLIREVGLFHIPQPVAPDDAIFHVLAALPNEPGISLFKKAENTLVRLAYEDVPFLKKYYAVEIGKDENGRLERHINEYTVTAAVWGMYEYYPSGRLFRRTKVGLAATGLQPVEHKHLPRYALTVTEYEDADKPKQIVPTHTVYTQDVNHKLWLPNMLHD